MVGTDQVAHPHADDGAWAAAIRAALADLDDVQRCVLELVYAHGLTQRQAATRLQLSTSTVAGHVARALQRIAAVLH